MLAAINENIDSTYWWLTAVTLPLWCRAIWWNVKAVKVGVVEGAKMRAATAALALIYFIGNCVLLFSNVSPSAWSDVMRGFMVLSIPIVWELPARFSVKMAGKIRDADRRIVEKYDGEA